MFLVIILSKKKKKGAVLCVTAQSGEQSFPYEDELSFQYSVSTFH